jgi:hypothetical protein
MVEIRGINTKKQKVSCLFSNLCHGNGQKTTKTQLRKFAPQYRTLQSRRNGVAERLHQEVWKHLRTLSAGERDWDRFVTAVQHMEVLGMTPFQAMFGRKMLDLFNLVMQSSFSEDLKMFISPAEWRALHAQLNKVRREHVGVLGPLDDRKYLVAWEGYPNEFDLWRPARDLLQETINKVEKEFGGAEASDFPLRVDAHSSDAGISLSSVDHLVAERVVSNSAPSTVLDALECILDDFIIVSTRNTRQAGCLYTIRCAGQSKDESVPERQIPPNRCVLERFYFILFYFISVTYRSRFILFSFILSWPQRELWSFGFLFWRFQC